MRLDEHEALSRLAAHDHAVLCTVHPRRGVDAVPVVYALDGGGHVGVPVDLVKPKDSLRLQRQRNLEADRRATLLLEHWDRDDWTRLWWVRAEMHWVGEDRSLEETLAVRLADRYPQYRDRPFARVLVFSLDGITGWAASPGAGTV